MSTLPERTVMLAVADDTIAALLSAALTDEGYRVRTIAAAEAPAALVAAEPQAVVVVGAGRGDPLPLLDALRSTPETSRTAVVVLSLHPHTQLAAQASGNVHASLMMPFDLADFLEAVASAAAGRPAEIRLLAQPLETDTLLRRAADVLAAAERDVVLRWLAGARRAGSLAGRADIDPSDFLNAMPRILNLVVLGLRHRRPPEAEAAEEALEALDQSGETRQRIRHHSVERVAQNAPLAETLAEYHLLREVVRQRLERDLAAEEVLAVLPKLHALLDECARVAIEEYLRLGLESARAEGQGQ